MQKKLVKMTLLRSSESFRKTFNGVAMIYDKHDGNTRDFADTTFQIFITSSNNVTAILEVRKEWFVVFIRRMTVH